jgi:CubicO group peptidase (beta-lactamase class C family)
MRTPSSIRSLVLFVGFAVASAVGAPAQPAARAPQATAGRGSPFDSARALIRRAIDDGLPSIAVAVAKDGRIIWEEGFGWADRERMIPATQHTMYSLASISKPITATGLMKLVERGLVNLERPANDYLGTGRLTATSGDPSRATVRHVLSHTAGLPLHYQFFYANAGYGRPPMDQTISRYGVLMHAPGDVYQYSNLGYGIIDHIISRVSRQSYSDYMRTEVFLPLGLTRTSVDIGPGLESYVAQRYDSKQRPIPFYTFDHAGGSAIYSSAHDLVRFGMFHLKNRLPEQRRILGDSMIDAMQRIQTPDTTTGGYGLGWSITRDDNGYRRISHSGGMPGVATVLSLYPSENVAIVALTNRSDGAPFRIAEEIAAAVLPRYAATRNERRARQASAPPTPAPAFPPAELAGAWTGTVRTYDGTMPIALLFQPDGDVHVTLGNQLKSLLNRASYTAGNLVGRFAGTISTDEQRRHPHVVSLNLRLRDGVLRGQASAMTTEEPVYYALTSYVELAKVADRPLSAEDVARFTGTYTASTGALVRVSTDGGKLKVEGGGRPRILLYQGDNSFVASDDPGLRVLFRPGADGKAAIVTLTLGGQTTEARRSQD